MSENGEFTHQEQIDIEVKRLAHKLKGNCNTLFQFSLKIYSQIIEDNQTRVKALSFKKIQDIVHSMPELVNKKDSI